MGKGGCHSWTENCLFGELLSQVTAKLGPCGDPFSGGGCECRVMFLECKEMVGQAKRVSSRLLESCLKLRREDKECVIAHWTHLMEATVEPLEMHFPRESLERKRVFRVSHTKQGRLTREGTEGSFTHTNTHAPTHTHRHPPSDTPNRQLPSLGATSLPHAPTLLEAQVFAQHHPLLQPVVHLPTPESKGT